MNFFKDLNEEKVSHIPDYVLLPEDIDSLSNLQCNETINSPITVYMCTISKKTQIMWWR